MEQLDIRRASDEFAEQVEEYRKYFRARAPFAVADPQLTLAHVRVVDQLQLSPRRAHHKSGHMSGHMSRVAPSSGRARCVCKRQSEF